MPADAILKRAQAVLPDSSAAQFAYFGSALPSPKDDEITRLVEDYRAEPPPERLKIAAGLSIPQAYALSSYSHRMALSSARKQSPAILRNAIAALLMAGKVNDPRESSMALSVPYRVAELLGLGDSAFRGAAADAPDADVEQLLLGFLKRPNKTVQAMGFREEMGKNGLIIVYGQQPVPAGFQ